MFSTKNTNKVHKLWITFTLILILIASICFASITIYIDPVFHYHAPLANYEYPLNDWLYQNDGIIRNFEYDSIITGSSMTANFMKTEADQTFNANFIKVPFFGGLYKEVNDNLLRAYNVYDKDIRYVIRSLDYSCLVQDKNAYRDYVNYPTYLYNENPFDDVNYVLNKSILFYRTKDVIQYTQDGNKTTSFDVYTNWNANYTFGAEAVLNSYTLEKPTTIHRQLTEDERQMVLGNIRQNVTDLADEHPQTTFYLFFPPYSICYWDVLNNDGKIDWHIEAEKVAIEEILKHPNIKLFSFCNNFELVCNLDNYYDQAHYGEQVNSQMLEWMRNDEYLLTEKNYLTYINTIKQFYTSYDYNSLRE